MAPVYASDRKAPDEDETFHSHNGFAIVGLLWLVGFYVTVKDLALLGVSPVTLCLAVAGACLPLLIVRLRGSRDAVGRLAWATSAALFAAGLIGTALTSLRGFFEGGSFLRWFVAVQAGVLAVEAACGGYVVSRVVGSLARERRMVYVATAVLIGLNVLGRTVLEDLGRMPLLMVWALQAAVVVWTYVRLLAARPHVKRIAGVFE